MAKAPSALRSSAWLMILSAGLSLVATTLVACGPSYRVRRANAKYYERCRAAEVDPNVSSEQRVACWTAWLEHYTYGEPVERVSHTRGRLAALSRGETAAPLPDRAAPATAGVEGSPAAPLIDNAPATPPAPDSTEARAQYRAPPPVLPDTPCTPVCNAHWDRCIPRCDARGSGCAASCRARYRACIAGCY